MQEWQRQFHTLDFLIVLDLKMNSSGYSGTPLSKKLGFKPGYRVKIVHAPVEYLKLLHDLPNDILVSNDSSTQKNLIHYFTRSAESLHRDVAQLKKEIVQDGMIWISWPKKSARVKTDLNGNLVREIGLRYGLVDIKVCSVNETWSALKFVIPLKDRI